MATSSDLGEGSDLGGGGSSRRLGSYQAFTPDGGGITTIEDGVRSEDSTEYTLGVIPDFEVDGGSASGSLTPDAEPKNLHVKASDTKEKVAQGSSPQPPRRSPIDSMDDTEPSSGLLTIIVPDHNDEQPSLLGLGAEVYVPNGGGGHSQHDSVSSASGTVTGSSSGSISGASVSTTVYQDQNVSTNTAVHAGGDAFGEDEEEEPTSALRQQQQHVANTSMDGAPGAAPAPNESSTGDDGSLNTFFISGLPSPATSRDPDASTSTVVYAGQSIPAARTENPSICTAPFNDEESPKSVSTSSPSSSSDRTDPLSSPLVPEYSLRSVLSKTTTDLNSAMNTHHKRKSLSWSHEHEFFEPALAGADDGSAVKDRKRLLCESPKSQKSLDLNHFMFDVESVGTSDDGSVSPVGIRHAQFLQKKGGTPPPAPTGRGGVAASTIVKPRGRYYKGGGQSKKVEEGTGLLDKPKPDGQGCPKCSVM